MLFFDAESLRGDLKVVVGKKVLNLGAGRRRRRSASRAKTESSPARGGDVHEATCTAPPGAAQRPRARLLVLGSVGTQPTAFSLWAQCQGRNARGEER